MRVSPRLKYPLVAGIGTTKSKVAVATSAAKMAAAAILNAADGVNLFVFSLVGTASFINITVL
jgi:hypothetical protein